MEKKGPSSKLVKDTSHINDLGDWLTGSASLNNMEEWFRMILSPASIRMSTHVHIDPQHMCAYTCANTHLCMTNTYICVAFTQMEERKIIFDYNIHYLWKIVYKCPNAVFLMDGMRLLKNNDSTHNCLVLNICIVLVLGPMWPSTAHYAT